MTIEGIGIIITAIISTISLALSFMNYWHRKPKIRISISDSKHDCFFAKKQMGQTNQYECIAGGYINIINNSPVSITLNELSLKVGKENYGLIDKSIVHWQEVELFYKGKNGKWITDGSVVPYEQYGLLLPRKVEAYDAFSCHVLFRNFPAKMTKKCKGTLILNSAIGKIKKRVVLYEYNQEYCNYEWKDIEQYQRSIASAREDQ